MQYPTGVSQRTWAASASEVITASLLRANVTAPLWLITSPPMAILAQQLTANSIPSGSRNTVNILDTEILDSNGGHSDSVNNFRYYVPVTGWWLVRATIPFSAATTNSNFSFMAGITGNHSGTGTNFDGARHSGPPSASAVVIPSAAELLPLTAASPVITGDFVTMYAFQDTGSSVLLGIGGGGFPWLATRWAGVQGGTAGLPVPSPAAFSDLTAISGTFLNSNVRDTINFLAFPPMARLSNQGGSQTVPNNSETAITWNTATVLGVNSDNYGGWSSGTNPTRYTFPVAGRYWVHGQAAFGASSAATWQVSLRVNGSSATEWFGGRVNGPGTSTAGTTLIAERYLRVNAGDYVEVMAFQNSGAGSAMAVTSPTTSKLIVLWRGA